MLIDVLGTNCTGKSSLIAKLVERPDIRYVDLGQYHYKYPDGWLTSGYQWLRLIRSPKALQCFLLLLRHGEKGLALRYAKFYFLFRMMVENADEEMNDVVVIDEGVIKKLYEAVPFVEGVAYERELKRWRVINSRIRRVLLESVKDIVSAMAYLYVEPEEYMSRVRKREFFTDRVSRGQIMGRYLIQCELYRQFLDQARKDGICVYEINAGCLANVHAQFWESLERVGDDRYSDFGQRAG